jgi:putative proteasome-type protease
MTYCTAIRLDSGLVFLADARTNAGVDHVSIFRKMTVFELPGERLMVLLAAGNLALTQAVRQAVQEQGARFDTARVEGAGDADGEARGDARDEPSVWHAPTMFDAARAVGRAVRTVWDRDADSLKRFGVDFNCNLLFGGQIRGERMRLFHVYSAGNFIEATAETPYLQIGEAKYGKPILDRVIRPDMPLDEAAKCALISMDSTLRSNVSVGLPLDLLVYEKDALRVTRFVEIDEDNRYMQMIRSTWGARLNQVFQEIPDPVWASGTPPSERSAPVLDVGVSAPVRASPPAGLRPTGR